MTPADQPGPLVFVRDVEAPELRDDDRHHLERVLRMRDGAPLTVGDGEGRWRTATFARSLEVTGPVETEPAPEPGLTVALALIKGERPEMAVQKLTEVGIDRIIPFVAERSVVRWDAERSRRHVARLRAVVRSAAMQCHRPRLPELGAVADFASVSTLPGAVLADRTGEAPFDGLSTVLVGPEGGWARVELSEALRKVRFSPTVMRSETACVVAGATMAALRARIVRAST